MKAIVFLTTPGEDIPSGYHPSEHLQYRGHLPSVGGIIGGRGHTMLSDYRDRDGASKGDKAETQLLGTKEWNKLRLYDNPRSPEVVTVAHKNPPMGNVFLE